MKKFVWMAVALFAAGTCAAHTPRTRELPQDTSIRVGKLSNGLTYYICRNNEPRERVDFYIAQRVGSILEEESQQGLAHFLEHMAFNGTKHFPEGTLLNYLESRGIKFGQNLNAYTSIDQTVYRINDVPANRSGLVDSCLLILHDWSGCISLDGEAIDRERKVIHEEWRTRSNAVLRMYDSLLPKLYPASRYAHRMPIGRMEVVDNFPYEVLRDYYHKWYRPDLQGIIVVGDINVDSTEQKIIRLWQDIPSRKNPARRAYFPVKNNRETIAAVATDPEATFSLVSVMYKHDRMDASRRRTTQGLEQTIIQQLYERMLNIRLDELTQRPNPPYQNASFSDGHFSIAQTKEAYTLDVVFRGDAWRPAIDAAVEELQRARQYGFTASEYQRAKAELLSQLENQYNEQQKRRNTAWANDCLQHFLDGEPLVSIEFEYPYLRERLPQLSVDSLNRVFRTMFPKRNVALMLMAPRKDSLHFPTENELIAAYDSACTVPVKPYVDQLSQEELVSPEPQAGTIVESQHDARFDATVWTLSNGARVVVKPTNFKGDEVLFDASSRGGTSGYFVQDSIYMNFPMSAARSGGLGKFTPNDLFKKLSGKQATATAYIGATNEGVTGQCVARDLKELLQLNYLIFTDPRSDTTLYGIWRDQTRSSILNQQADPAISMQDTLLRQLYGPSPRYDRTTVDRLNRYDYARIMQLYKERFADAGDFVFLFVGNVDTTQLRPLVERYLASLPSKPIHETESPIDHILPGSRTSHFDKTMTTAKASVSIIISGSESYSLKDMLTLSMLKQVMDIVYVATIRAEEGGTYGVSTSASLMMSPYDRFVFSIRFDTNDRQVDPLARRVVDELRKVADNGPEEATFNKVKEFMQKQSAQSVRDNNYWKYILNTYYGYGKDVHTEYLQTLNAMTPQDIAAVARRVVDSPNRVEVVMNGVQQ